VQANPGTLGFGGVLSWKDAGGEGRSAFLPPRDGEDPQQERPEFEIYSKARTVIDLTNAELLQAYPAETKDLDFDEHSESLASLLQLAGERIEEFFNTFPNTLSKEQVRMERLNPNSTLEEAIARNYLYSFSLDKTGTLWTETRTENDGRPIDLNLIREFSLTPGRAEITAFLHPVHQNGSRFRYFGRQSSPPNATVIAFA
jgi:hypothetical protein